MVDAIDDNMERDSKPSTLEACSSGNEWLTFEDPTEEEGINLCQTKEMSSSKRVQYLSQLEKELQRLQDMRKRPPSSRDIIRTLQEAKESHMRQLMNNNEVSETFLLEDSDLKGNNCCFPLYRTVFPKQPVNKEELDCLIEDEENCGGEIR